MRAVRMYIYTYTTRRVRDILCIDGNISSRRGGRFIRNTTRGAGRSYLSDVMVPHPPRVPTFIIFVLFLIIGRVFRRAPDFVTYNYFVTRYCGICFRSVYIITLSPFVARFVCNTTQRLRINVSSGRPAAA